MSRFLPCLAPLIVAGCHKSAQSLVQDQLAAMKDITAALDGIAVPVRVPLNSPTPL
ncbi:hypothetical protein [Limnoglobus roseus]|uniref:Lipoprotein n=1 Tax=Limnoglobus roseus TaxID=2598579 RepID=A0A5C1AQZ4_9BACT|nr:hypothetical protein [Limnoglobus roseus]QEL20627.1 hypothetical protein PX52LOC_07732 [Limnoglobus roseus]